MAAIHTFFPMTYGNPDDGRHVPTFEDSIPIFKDSKRVVNHPPRTSTMRSISSALLNLLPWFGRRGD